MSTLWGRIHARFYINAILVLLEHATCLLKHQLPYSMFVVYSNALCVYMLHTSLSSHCTSIQKRSIMASTSLSSLFIWHHCQNCLYSGIATFIFESRYKYYFCSHKPDHIWQWVVNTQVASLVWAGLGTEWIYDAFAGKSSFKCFTLHFVTKLYELTNLVLTL